MAQSAPLKARLYRGALANTWPTDAKLQAIGDMIHDASKPEKQRRLTD